LFFVFIAIWMVQIVLFDLGVSGSPCFNEYWIIHRLWLFDLGIYELCLVWYRYVIILQHFFYSLLTARAFEGVFGLDFGASCFQGLSRSFLGDGPTTLFAALLCRLVSCFPQFLVLHRALPSYVFSFLGVVLLHGRSFE
jgi:hypothetical protein